MQPFDSFQSRSLHCTVLLCQPVSHDLEQDIQAPVTHLGHGVGVEGPGAVGCPGTRTAGADEGVVVVLEVVDVLVVVEAAAVLCKWAKFEIGMTAADGCCGVVRRGMKKL